MSSVRRFAKNTILLLGGRICGYGLFFLFSIYTARYLGVANFGVLSFALAFSNLFGMLGDLGVRKVITRDLARDTSQTHTYVAKIITLRIILAIGALIATIALINVLGYPDNTRIIVYIFALAIGLRCFSNMFFAVFQSHEKMQYESFGLIIFNGLLLLGAFGVIYTGFGLKSFALVYLLGSVVVLLYSGIFYCRLVSFPKLSFDLSFVKTRLNAALPFGLIGVSEMVYQWSDSLMLSMMVGNKAVGWYSVAYRLFQVTLLLPSVCGAIIFPMMSRFYVSSSESLRFVHERYFKHLTAIGGFLALGCVFFANKVIVLFWGAEYQPSVTAFQILAWSTFFIFLNASFVKLLEAANHQRILTKICIASAVFNIALNLILIPSYSYVGAAISTILSELLITVFVINAARKTKYKVGMVKMFIVLIKLIISGLAASAVILCIQNHLFWPVVALIASLVYFVVLCCLRGFDREDIEMVKHLLHWRKEVLPE